MYKKHCRAKLEKKFLPEVYISLDELPIKIWWDINETGNISLLLKRKMAINQNHILILNETFRNLINAFIKEHGFSDKYKEVIEKKKEMALHYVNLIVKEDNTEKVHIRILEREIKELQAEMSIHKGKNLDLKVYVDKFMGYSIDIYKYSVSEYMNCIKMMEAQNAA